MMKRAILECGIWAVVLAMVVFALAGCTTRTVYKDRPVNVSVPVAQPCAGERPATVATLRERYGDAQWQAMDARQKAAAVGMQALDRQTYGEQLEAATAACP